MKSINIKKIGTALILFSCILVLSAGSASYGHISSHGNVLKNLKVNISDTSCQQHLKNVTYEHNTKSQLDERAKSRAAAVGIMFGARFATDDDATGGKFKKVLAIKNYRSCLKEQALKGAA